MAIVQNNVTFNADLSDFNYTGFNGKYTAKINLSNGKYKTSVSGDRVEKSVNAVEID